MPGLLTGLGSGRQLARLDQLDSDAVPTAVPAAGTPKAAL